MSGLPHAGKSLGQHWLHDQAVLNYIVQSAQLTKDDIVLEIGPGLGTLTEVLVKRAGQVIAIELDEKLALRLPQQIKTDNLKIISQDILQFDFRELPAGYKVVANIPYYLTGKLLRLLSETVNPPATAVLLVQKEVAERVAAEPGSMSILSTTAQFFWEISLGQVIPAKLFTPPPKVDSQILILQRRQESLFDDIEPKAFFHIVKAGFAQPRKTLLNNLCNGLQYDRQEIQNICQKAEIDSQRRPQTLTLYEWHTLAQHLNA